MSASEHELPERRTSEGSRERDLITLGEDARARYLVSAESSGERIGIVVARPSAAARAPDEEASTDAPLRRAHAAARLSMPGVAPVREVGLTPGGHPFVSSDLGDGELVAELRGRGDVLDAAAVVTIVANAARIVGHAHASGVPHGSLGAETIGIGSAGRVFVHGFGAASAATTGGSIPLDEQDASAARTPDLEYAPPAARTGAATLARLQREDVRALALLLDSMLTADTGSEGRALLADAALGALLVRAAQVTQPMTAGELADELQRLVSDSAVPLPPAAATPARGSRRGLWAAVLAVPLLLLLLWGLPDGWTDRGSDGSSPSSVGREGPVPSQVAVAETAPDDSLPLPDRRGGSTGGDDEAAVRATAAGEVDPNDDREASTVPVTSAATPEREVAASSRAADSAGTSSAAGAGTGAAASTAPAPGPSAVALPAGTVVSLRSGERICTNTHLPGHRFSATVAEDVRTAAGVAIPQGARAVLHVTSVDQSEHAGELGQIGLAVRELVVEETRYPVDATITSVGVEQGSSTGSDAGAVVGGAVAGAVLGQVLGKDAKSTVIGAAAGAAAGTVIAMSTGGRAGCIPYRGPIALRLNTTTHVVTR